MKIIAGMQSSTTTKIRTVTAMPIPISAFRLIDEKIADGTEEMIDTKMISDMPLPTPC